MNSNKVLDKASSLKGRTTGKDSEHQPTESYMPTEPRHEPKLLMSNIQTETFG